MSKICWGKWDNKRCWAFHKNKQTKREKPCRKVGGKQQWIWRSLPACSRSGMIPRYNRTNDSNGIFVTSSALIDYDLYPRFTLAVCMKASEPHEFYWPPPLLPRCCRPHAGEEPCTFLHARSPSSLHLPSLDHRSINSPLPVPTLLSSQQ